MGLLGRLFGGGGDARTAAADRPAAFHDARGWLKAASGRPAVWHDAGYLALPGHALFVGDPTWGDDYHMRATATIGQPGLHVHVLRSGGGADAQDGHVNLLVWLEAGGTPPATRGRTLDFGVDAACFALGDVETGNAFTRLTDLELDAGRGDSFEWIGPYIQEAPDFARWLDIPPDGHRMFIVSTGNDGSFSAAWLHDQDDALSGILIDIAGRAGDGRFIDGLLPDRDG